MDMRSVCLTKELTEGQADQQKDSTLKVPGFISVMSQVYVQCIMVINRMLKQKLTKVYVYMT